MASILPTGKQVYLDNAGVPLVGGKVYTYAAGTSTLKATYQDQAGLIPNANPVVLNTRGEALIFWSGAYKIVLKDSLDNIIWSVDNVVEGGDASIITGSTGSLALPTGTTAQRDVSPSPGYLRFNNELVQLECYYPSGWKGIQEMLVSGTNIKTVGGVTLLGAGDIPTPDTVRIDVASTGTVDLTVAGPVATRNINITGVTTITGFIITTGKLYFVRFAGALTLTDSANLVTQRGANIITGAGDTCILRATAANTVEILNYTVAIGNSFISGQGGQTITGNITLTAFSSAAITVTPTAPGSYVTLPDATTCSTADNLFSVYNAGDYDYGVKDSAGTQLGWVRARTGAMIGLSDKSTAAGIWAYYGLEKTGITASYINPTLANMGNTIRRIALDATRTCFLFGGTDCYAIVYDASTQTWGSATLVRASIASGAFLGVLSATNQVLVCSNDSTTGMSTVTLTISGTTVTVNAPISTTLAGNWSSYGQLIPVSTSWVLSYGRATNISGIRAISVAGTVPTVGAETAVASSFAIGVTLFASGAVVRTLGWNGSTTINCIPYTLSAGTTLTVGTQATAVATSAPFRAFLNGNGNIVCHYINTTHFATVFKLTGTVEAASSVSLGTAPTSVITQADYVQVTASKTLFGYHAGSTTFYANLLTDTAGTATAGTEFSLNGFSAAINSLAGLVSSGNSARILYGNNTQQIQATFDCSGASPTLSSTVLTFFSSLIVASVTASDVYGIRAPRLQFAGATVTNIPSNSTETLATVTTANSIRAVVPMMIGISAASGSPKGVVGAANESILANTVSGTNGFTINRIEAAA
jgi:hypothetical protein